MMLSRFQLLLVVLAAAHLAGAGASFAAELPPPATRAVDYATDIQPILRANCYQCHGPRMQKGELRLDVKAHALRGGNSGAAIVPGKSADSLLIHNVSRLADALPMPPSGDPLTAEQIGLLRAWIDQGAIWPDEASAPQPAAATTDKISDHWSFKAPARHDPPAVNNADWPRNPIDNFVLARLEREGVAPSPEADRATLIRRASLDLVGLPPSPAEIDAFLNDDSPEAYEKLVDRLLASPHYGERWARPWLDAARYADTNGYEKDRPRSMWLYRDWVIDALNADMPFDQFTIEQIAGDMLPNATLDQIVATGFHRNTMINEEGGIDVEEFRYASVVDRVGTTGQVWLGLTIACAQCHDHKYDPISHREYFQMFAFLNNADEPEIEVPLPGVVAQRREIEAKINRLEEELPSQFPLPKSFASSLMEDSDKELRRLHLESKFAEWEKAKRAEAAQWRALAPARYESSGGATMTLLGDGSVLATGDRPNRDTYTLEFEIDSPTPARAITALRLEALPDDSLPNHGPGRGSVLGDGNFMLSEIEVHAAPVNSEAWTTVTLAKATADFSQKNSEPEKSIDKNLETGWAINGEIGEPHWAVYQLKEPLSLNGRTRLRVRLVHHYIHQQTLGRFRISMASEDRAIAASSVPPEIESILLLDPDTRTAQQQAALLHHFLLTTPELADAQKEIADLRASMPPLPTTLVMQERAEPRATHVHPRGEFLRKGVEVEPGVPAVLHSLPENEPRNRLTFARWLVDERNPLVARVTVNRIWQSYFGRGIVATSQDFGTQGESPSHPELLDWLATEFMRSGWSQKAIHRLIATSATYRQSSRVTPENYARDPENVLLARGPRFRLEAETIRDFALASSGLLSDKIGGPSVFPPQPEGVTELAYGSPKWKTSKGEDRYRRGLYTHLKRTTPYPAFITFDGPTADTACTRRNRSNTPLQALTLLNDEVFVEAAQALAARVMESEQTNEARARLIFQICTARAPSQRELAKLLDFRERQLTRIRSGELDAQKIALAPSQTAPNTIDLAELAAWVTVARAVMNLDETITKQ